MDKKGLSKLDLSSIEDYFELICNMHIQNYNIKNQIEALTPRQMDSFIKWLDADTMINSHEVKKLAVQQIQEVVFS